jgi:hypothetical protein
VAVRLAARTVKISVKGERIAVHLRSSGNGKHTTAADHMPSSHRRYADWTIGRIRRDAALIGPATAALCDLILEQRPHPEQGFRSCLAKPTVPWCSGTLAIKPLVLCFRKCSRGMLEPAMREHSLGSTQKRRSPNTLGVL